MSFDKMDARVGALRLICKWQQMDECGLNFEQARRQLIGFLGHKTWSDVKFAHYEEDDGGPITNHLQCLNGPNGYTYYKMLLARCEET
jgi:hypothetical protein